MHDGNIFSPPISNTQPRGVEGHSPMMLAAVLISQLPKERGYC